MPLSHYRNSRASMQNEEPVYLNQFEVSLVAPQGLNAGDLLIQNIKKISGLEVDKMPATVEQFYKQASRRYAGTKPESTSVDITIDFEVNVNDANSMYVYKILRQWCNLVYDPLTGRMGLKREYIGGPLTISVHTKAGDVIRQLTFPVIFPMSQLPAMELDYASEEIWTLTITFAADYWNDITV